MADQRDPFRARHQRAMKKLPPLEQVLRGSIIERSLRCGKPGCHCAAGDGHGITYLSVTHPGGRTEQISLPADLVATAEQWVDNYKAWWRAIEEISAINRDLLRQRRHASKPAASPGRTRRRRP